MNMKLFNILIYRYMRYRNGKGGRDSFLTVNQRVASSSLAGGALLDKPAEMSAFSLITSQFDSCNSCC
jgi:hypothetical protein